MLLASWALLPALPALTEFLLAGDPEQVAHGKKILHPNMALHLAVSFVSMQLVATAAVFPLIRPVSNRLRPASKRFVTSELAGRGPTLAAIVEGQRTALDAAHRVWLGDASAVSELDGQLESTRTAAEKHLERDPRLRVETQDGILIGVMALQQSIEHLRNTTGRLARRAWTLEGNSRESIAAMHELVRAGLCDDLAMLDGEEGPTLERLRSREIETNSREAQLRKALETEMRGLKGEAARRLLLFAELAGAYEGIGNQVYRLGMSLAPDDDDF